MEITSLSNNPKAATEWWRYIWHAKSIYDLVSHEGHPQLEAKLAKTMMAMAKGDLRRDIADANTKLHKQGKALLGGRQMVWMMYNSLQCTSVEKGFHDLKSS